MFAGDKRSGALRCAMCVKVVVCRYACNSKRKNLGCVDLVRESENFYI